MNSNDFKGEFGALNAGYSVQNNIPHRSNALLSIVGSEVAIFGGKRANVGKYLNDLWTIDLSNFQSKWTAGDSTYRQIRAIWGPLKKSMCQPLALEPRVKFGFTADASNDLWLYGGLGFSQVRL